MKVAIIHYWLVNMRGGEKVIEALCQMFPEADIFTHVYSPKAMSDTINSHFVYTSRINRLPFAEKLYQLYMPLMPDALLDFNLQDYDLVISSESGPAKGVIPNPNVFHICYCHSPMRYLYDAYHEYLKNTNFFVRFFMKKLIPGLQLKDIVSSNFVDCFVANSSFVSKRIKRYYNRDSVIIHPPCDIDRFLAAERLPKEKQDYYLFFGQLTGYKKADIAIEACIKSRRKLIIAGAGKKNKIDKKYLKSGLITFKGHISDQEIKELYSGAKALLFPGIEDFGIIPVEANAAGCPVIAYRSGGACDSVKENETGLFFDEQTPDSLIQAMNKFESDEYKNSFNNREVFTNHVKQFSHEVFKQKITEIIQTKKRI